MNKRTILLVEDEAAIRDMVIYTLGREHFHVHAVASVVEAKTFLKTNTPDLILLDWMLPGVSGIDYVPQLRSNKQTKHIPVIMLTAKAEEENKVRGLTMGADDYVTKPFSPRELIARIQSVLRRGVLIDVEGVISFKNMQIDLMQHCVTIENQPVQLSRNEFKLLTFFVKYQNRVYSREQLLSKVWGSDTEIDDRAVDVRIRRLRKALKVFNYDRFIKTVHGVGYKFAEVGE